MRNSPRAEQLLDEGSHRDPQRDQAFAFSQTDDQFLVREVGGSNVTLPVTWLLGSGTHAQTPISVDAEAKAGVEFRWSWFANSGNLGITPDHERFENYRPNSLECFGRPMDDQDVRSCLGCHSTLGPPPPIPPHEDLYVPNVGCERCHGPRKKHVDSARQGIFDDKPLVQFNTASDYLDQCAQCHRDEKTVSPSAQPHELARFQPYGLKRSRCFQAAPEQMTCSTCHDPHDTVGQDRATYNDACRQCHQTESQKRCGRSPQGDCVACHMARVEWVEGISFHDHNIRIHAE